MSWQPTYQDRRSRRRRRGRVSGRTWVILLVIIVVAIGWYLLGFLAEPEPAVPSTAAGSVERTGESLSGRIARPAVPADNAGLPAGGERGSLGSSRNGAERGQEARALIEALRAEPRGDALGEAHREAEELRAAGRLVDAYLLHFYAARKGHAPSALALGSMADPGRNEQDTGYPGGPNLFEAHKWYELAAAQGDPVAPQRLTELRRRAEAAAAAGDARASRLLLQWR